VNFQKENHIVTTITLTAEGVVEFRDRLGVFHADKAQTIFTTSEKSYIGVECGPKGFQFDVWNFTQIITPSTTVSFVALNKIDTNDTEYQARRTEILEALYTNVSKGCCDAGGGTQGLQDVLIVDPNLTQANTIDGGGFDQTITNVSKLTVESTTVAGVSSQSEVVSDNAFLKTVDATTTAVAQTKKSGGFVSAEIRATDATGGTAVEAYAKELRIVTPKVDDGTAVVNQVATLKDAATGEVEYETSTSVNIYNSDGTLTADRTVDGNGLFLKFINNSYVNFQGAPGPTTTVIGHEAEVFGINSTVYGHNAAKGNTQGSVQVYGYNAAKNNTGSGVTAIGYEAALQNSGPVCLFVGNQAGQENTAPACVGIGGGSLFQNIGMNSAGYGNGAGFRNQGNDIIAIGHASAFDNLGNKIVSLGYHSAYQNTKDNVIAIGHEALKNNIGDNIIAIGVRSLINNVNDNIIAIGDHALSGNFGAFLVAIGYYAGDGNQGSLCVFIGENAGQNNVGGTVHAIGYYAAESNLGNDVSAIGYEAAKGNTGTNVNAFGNAAANLNTGTDVNAFGNVAAQGNTGTSVNSFGSGSAQNNVGNDVMAVGSGSAQNNVGNDVMAVGSGSAKNNIGNNVNALGNGAADGTNTGNNVNALGQGAGNGNIYNNVNLFGEQAQALADGQTVLSKDAAIMERLGTTNLTASRLHEFPNADGTFIITVNGLAPDSAGNIVVAAGSSGITRSKSVQSSSFTVGSTALTDYTYFISGTTTATLPTAVGNNNRYTFVHGHVYFYFSYRVRTDNSFLPVCSCNNCGSNCTRHGSRINE
jgi:hypothetical protein